MKKELDTFDNLVRYTSMNVRKILLNLPDDLKMKIEEIRLRNGKPLNLNYQGKDFFMTKEGEVTAKSHKAYIVTQEEISNTFQLVTKHSIYAYTEEIKKGFITINGGHRIGLGGQAIYSGNSIENIKNISSLNMRIAREKKGISDKLFIYLLENGNFQNTLIISPPQGGKTTLLRDLVRNLSNGYGNGRAYKIGLIDERSEIASIYRGMAQNDIGIRTDVLDGCLKEDGIMMFIRSMSPEIIAVDEIGGKEDIEAIEAGLRAGIMFLATIHGHDFNDIRARKNLDNMIRSRVFKRYLVLDNSRGVGTVKEIIHGDTLKNLYTKIGEENGII